MNVTIEKLVYGGEGLARVSGDGPRPLTVFVPFVLPGEEVEVTLGEPKKGFAHARLDSILKPSAERRSAPCPYFQRCGGCHYQHLDYPQQVEAKREILRETLRRTGKVEWTGDIPAITGEPFHYRNRTRMRLHHLGDFQIGYYQYKSHKLIAVHACPISSPLINRALAALWKLGGQGVVPSIIREIEFFADASDERILLELVLHAPLREGDEEALTAFSRALQAELPALAGCSAFLQQGGVPAYAQPVFSFGESAVEYATPTDRYRVSAGSFFQTNRFLTEKLAGLVTDDENGRLALDLYAGTGLFTLPLARRFEQVVAVESAPASFADLRANVPANVKPVRSTTEDYLRSHGRNLKPDLIVVDPPRAGLGDKILPILGQVKSSRLCYVSCDPATLARDLRALVDSGYRIDSIQLIDLFPQTFHLESVVRLSR